MAKAKTGTTKTGKRTAHIQVQTVEDGSNIEMYLRGMDHAPIIFKASSGRSGPKAYGRLKKFIDAEGTVEEGTAKEGGPAEES